jgi:DNA-binding transcriptional ArsR family regulator
MAASKTVSKNGKSYATADFRKAADTLKQFSDTTRYYIMMLLLGGEQNVTQICTAIGNHTQPAVSHHLALLRAAGLIEPRRDGKCNFYALTERGRSVSGALTGIRA